MHNLSIGDITAISCLHIKYSDRSSGLLLYNIGPYPIINFTLIVHLDLKLDISNS
jgi:hypothetical protein